MLLAVLGTGVFLAGLELMITAVALPAIVIDLADWTRLREASWIINGYLLVYVVTMPLAGRLADLYGTRRLFLWALVVFTVGSLLAGAGADARAAHRRAARPGGRRRRRSSRWRRPPPRTCSAAPPRPRALGVIGALTFLGMAAGPFLGAAILGAFHPEAALSRLGVEAGTFAGHDPRAGLALGVLRQRPDRASSRSSIAWAASSGWETPRRAGRVDLAGRGPVLGVPRSARSAP